MIEGDNMSDSFQDCVGKWLIDTFGPDISQDKIERCMRFLEEGLELVQAFGLSRLQATTVLNYVYDRPVGEVPQEVGGTMVTLAALCGTSGVSMSYEGWKEYRRINKLEMRVKIAAKNVTKQLFGMTGSDGRPPVDLSSAPVTIRKIDYHN